VALRALSKLTPSYELTRPYSEALDGRGAVNNRWPGHSLDAATAENVEQMSQVLTTLFRQHSQAASHSFSHSNWLILDVDLTGMPCGKKAEKSVKGYFHQPRCRRGRKPGRVLASQYGEIVVDELYPGNTILLSVLPSLIEKAEHVLQLTPWKRQHTILRIDAGGGTVDAIRSLLDQGYAVVSKEYSAARANQLVKSVKEWVEDPGRPARQIGWGKAGNPGVSVSRSSAGGPL